VASPALRLWARRLGWTALGTTLGLIAGAYLVLFALAKLQPALEEWHTIDLRSDRPGKGQDLADWLSQEQRLFETLDQRLSTLENLPVGSRFDPESPTHPRRLPYAGNRSFELTPEHPIGAVLLLHGLTDSPASLRAIGESLAQAGFRVLALRMPGHGTAPAGIATVKWQDWRDVAELGLAELTRDLPPKAPLSVVGYSNGTAVALEISVRSLLAGRRAPDRLVFLSPALAVDPLAAYAHWQLTASALPGLGPLAWQGVEPEVDPWKYQSFPVNAIVQIDALTRTLETHLQELERAGRLSELPPILSAQSVVDATIPPLLSLSRLYSRIHRADSELILFDANRAARLAPLLGSHVDELFTATAAIASFPFRVTLVTNRSPEMLEVIARVREAGTTSWTDEDLGLAWPPDLASLSHVAIPFPASHPLYGTGAGTAPLPFGALESRGERDLALLPTSLLGRQRWNPFYPYLEARILEFLGRDGSEGRSDEATNGPRD
jgi:alpha-beta hydrolase superfamily lysophospholipase